MRVNDVPNLSRPRALAAPSAACRLLLAAVMALLYAAPPVHADEAEQVEAALVELAKAQEAQGFDFRADIWERELAPEMGKAVRVQFFKGNEYRVCVAVAPKSGVKILAHVLDADGKPIESKTETVAGGWGVTLTVKPKRTGVYMVTIRSTEDGAQKKTLCAMISGYK